MTENFTLFTTTAEEAVSSPPILIFSPPLVLTFLGFLVTTILAAIEVYSSSSSSSHQRASPGGGGGGGTAAAAAAAAGSNRQSQSPNNGHASTRASTSSRSKGGGGIASTSATATSVSNLAAGGGNSFSDSPESHENLQEGWKMPRSTNGRGGQRIPNRNKMGGSSSSSVNYGSISKNQGGIGPGRGPAGTSGDESAGGGGSTGDNTRESFYKLLFIALLSRMILLPVEGVFLDSSKDPNDPWCTFVRTLPDLMFASAFSLLVLFYAQLAGTASGGGPRGLSLILLRPGYFRNGNLIVYTVYFTLLCVTVVYPGELSQHIFQSVLWSVLSLLYFVLLALLTYFGPVLVTLLRPSLKKRSGLAIRLISMCILCSIVFLSRAVSFAFSVGHIDVKFLYGILPSQIISRESESHSQAFVRDCVGYTLLEMIPSLSILFMMHTRRPKLIQSGDDTIREGGRYMPIAQNQQHGAVSVAGQSNGMEGNDRRVQLPSKHSTERDTVSSAYSVEV